MSYFFHISPALVLYLFKSIGQLLVKHSFQIVRKFSLSYFNSNLYKVLTEILYTDASS